MHTKASVIAFALLCLALGTVAISAQQSSRDQRQPNEVQHVGGGATAPAPAEHGAIGMGEKCAMMQKEMDKMQKGMHQSQEKMDGLLRDMNAATGPAKIDSVAAVVNEMATRSDKMYEMHAGMMQHMSAHMMQGEGAKAHKEMMMCPMMKGHESGGEHGERSTPGAEGEHVAPVPPADGGAEDHSAHHPPA